MDYLQNSNSSSSCGEYLLWKLENRLESKCMRLKTFLTSFDLHFGTTPFWKSICPSYRAPFTWLWSRLWSPLSKNLTFCSKCANKLSRSCVHNACPKLSSSMSQVVNNLQQPCWYHQTCCKVVPTSPIQSWYNNIVYKLLTACNKRVDIIRLVARLFQQVRYSHDITILYKLFKQLVTSLLILSNL
jgi:hypothetical protein